jgi:hypothetical protein
MENDRKLEILLTPSIGSPQESYFWAILEYDQDCWVNTGICGWAGSPERAFNQAMKEIGGAQDE